jgi:hypothetical protein
LEGGVDREKTPTKQARLIGGFSEDIHYVTICRSFIVKLSGSCGTRISSNLRLDVVVTDSKHDLASVHRGHITMSHLLVYMNAFKSTKTAANNHHGSFVESFSIELGLDAFFDHEVCEVGSPRGVTPLVVVPTDYLHETIANG